MAEMSNGFRGFVHKRDRERHTPSTRKDRVTPIMVGKHGTDNDNSESNNGGNSKDGK